MRDNFTYPQILPNLPDDFLNMIFRRTHVVTTRISTTTTPTPTTPPMIAYALIVVVVAMATVEDVGDSVGRLKVGNEAVGIVAGDKAEVVGGDVAAEVVGGDVAGDKAEVVGDDEVEGTATGDGTMAGSPMTTGGHEGLSMRPVKKRCRMNNNYFLVVWGGGWG